MQKKLIKLSQKTGVHCPPLGVVQTSIDALRDLLQSRQAKKGKREGTLGWDGEHYRMVEMTDEIAERQSADAKEALAFAQGLTLLPAEASSQLQDQLKPIFDNLDQPYIDTILAAQGSGRILLCDDRPLRELATDMAGIKGVWTQAAAKLAADSGTVTLDEYTRLSG